MFKIILMVNGSSETPQPGTVTGVDLHQNQNQEAECVYIIGSHTCAGAPVLGSHDAFAGYHEKNHCVDLKMIMSIICCWIRSEMHWQVPKP